MEAGLNPLVEEVQSRRDAAEGEPGIGASRIEVTLTGDRRDIEALSLEFRRLAKEHGLELEDLRLLPANEPPLEDAAEGGSS